jgi:hypothetical protein
MTHIQDNTFFRSVTMTSVENRSKARAVREPDSGSRQFLGADYTCNFVCDLQVQVQVQKLRRTKNRTQNCIYLRFACKWHMKSHIKSHV